MHGTLESESRATAPGVAERFAAMTDRQGPDEYNFAHFQRKHLAYDAQATVRGLGIRPGDLAPDFAILRVGEGTFRLSAYRGRPVLLHFGSPT